MEDDGAGEAADSAPEIQQAVEDVATEQVADEDVEITTEIEETDSGQLAVTRTAAFAELADRPKRKAIDGEKVKGDIQFYDDLRAFDPELAGTLFAQSQATAAGLDVAHPSEEEWHVDASDLEMRITEECRKLAEDLNLKKEGVAIVRDILTHGNDVSHIEYDETDGITDLTVLPLRALTIVDTQTLQDTDGSTTFYHGTGFGSTTDMRRVITNNEWYVINEGHEDQQQIYPEHDVLHIAINRRRNWYKDRKGRETFNVWGERRLEPVEYSVQVKQNTLANKVAMDDKLLAREFYKVNVEELFGHIEDPDRRQKKAEEYARELRKQVENLEADQKPILPAEVEIEVKGPDGETARNLSNFIQTMNDSIQHALTYHVASFGRDAGGTDRGNRPAKEMSDNSVRQLRDAIKTGFERLFEYHTILTFPEAREVANPEFDDIRRYELRDDITLPVLTFDPVDPQEQSEKVRDAISLYEKGVLDLNEARNVVGARPVEEDELEEMLFFKEPGAEDDDDEGDSPTDDNDDDGGDGPGDGPGGNRRSYPTDSEGTVEPYKTDPDEWEDLSGTET